jgi:hypothetical protein
MRLSMLLTTILLAGSTLSASAQVQFDPRERRDDNFRRDDRSQRGPEPSDFSTRLRTYRFAEVLRPTPLPRSRGAAMCSLTTVDDDSPNGWCKVFFDEQLGEWMSQTGGTDADQYCEATCMWIGPRADEEEVQERPRYRRFQ